MHSMHILCVCKGNEHSFDKYIFLNSIRSSTHRTERIKETFPLFPFVSLQLLKVPRVCTKSYGK